MVDLEVRSNTVSHLDSILFSLPPDGPSSESCYASHVWSSSLDEKKTRLVQRVPTEIQLTGE